MPSPEETTAAARAFLADHPDTADALAALIARDADDDPWTFADTELDSGRFGELVSRNLAYSVDDGYRLYHPEAIQTALENTVVDVESSAPATPTSDTADADTHTTESQALVGWVRRVSSTDPTRIIGLVGVLTLVAAARLVAAPDVFQDGFVVSPENDTYFFRYWQEQLTVRANGIFDIGLFADMGGAARTRPLSHAINWWVTELMGGVEAAPLVAAWLPVVAAVLLGYVVYRLAWQLTADIRVSLAAVVFYGLAPVHVVYTSVGFFDHQLHQYLWLGLLVLVLTTLASDVARRSDSTSPAAAASAHARAPLMWITAAGLAVTVAASAHLWGGSPLTFVPVAAVVGFRVIADVHHDASPAYGNAPLGVGLTVGAGLSLGAHHWLGWHETISAVTPLLVAGGALIVIAAGELWRRTHLPVTGLVGLEALTLLGGLVTYRLLRPQDFARLQTRAGDLFFREGATETLSLFSPEFSVIFGPLLQLGLGFYLGVGVLTVVTWQIVRRYEPAWLVPVCFAWYYTLLATIQVRFAGQLAILIAPFAGIGLVYLLAAIDLARPVHILGRESNPDETSTSRPVSESRSATSETAGHESQRSRVTTSDSHGVATLGLPTHTAKRGYLIGAVVAVLLFNLVLVPPLVGQATHDRAQFDAAQAIDQHADTADREYPANFVLSHWGDNRMYNYFVSGEARSYAYAQSDHQQFLTDADPDAWYDRFDGRVGYIVLADREGTSPENTTYRTLYDGLGVGANNTTATGHYQLLTAADGVRAFVVVPGAVINVESPAGEQATATTTVGVGTDTQTYTRRSPVTNGTATIRVAHPGEYTVANRTVSVTPTDVLAGNQTAV